MAEAVVSPSAILAAGAGTALGIATGLGPLAVLTGLAAWGARVALAVPRRRVGERIDPMAVQEPWREFVADALQAERRFDEVVNRSRPGPIRKRLQIIDRRIGDGVKECWRIACQGDALAAALRSLDEPGIRRQLAEVQEERRRAPANEAATFSLARTQSAIEAQLASAQRLRQVADDAASRLRLLNAQLDEAVARSLEISLHAGDVSQLGPLSQDVEGVVVELESLRQALEEAGSMGGGAGGTTAAG